MTQSLIYAVVIMLTLFCVMTVMGWPWLKCVQSIQFTTAEIQGDASGPDGRLSDPYHYHFTISYSAVAEAFVVLMGVSLLIGMVSGWIFGRKTATD